MIVLENVSKKYVTAFRTVDALNNVSLKINEGDFTAIIGTSGSGKSTLINILGCLDSSDEGKCLIDAVDISMLSSESLSSLRSEKIGFVFQNYKLLPKQSVINNVMLPLVFQGKEKNIRQCLAENTLKKLGIYHLKDNLAIELSGGQQQRVAIARAIVTKPKIILADEPTGNLDPKTASEILILLKMLNREGATILLITHDMEIAQNAKHIFRLTEGVLTQEK